MDEIDTYIMLGIPGSGKTTVGREVANRTGNVHLSYGDLKRQVKLGEHPLSDTDSFRGLRERIMCGETSREVMEEAQNDLFTAHLDYLVGNGELLVAGREGLILDGYPKYLNQLNIIQDRTYVRGIFYLEVDFSVARGRVFQRGVKRGDEHVDLERKVETGNNAAGRRREILRLFPNSIKHNIDANLPFDDVVLDICELILE